MHIYNKTNRIMNIITTIQNHLNTQRLSSIIARPFIKISSLFKRIFESRKIKIVENPKYSFHYYTKINKSNNGQIERYLPHHQTIQKVETQVKNGQKHPFLKEMKAPHIPPKNRLLRAELKAKAMKLSMPHERVMPVIVNQMVSRV